MEDVKENVVEKQEQDQKQDVGTFLNPGERPVRLKIIGQKDVLVPPRGTVTGPASVLSNYSFLRRVDSNNQKNVPVTQQENVEDTPVELDNEDMPEIPEEEDKSSGITGPEKSLYESGVWYPSMNMVDYDEINYQKVTNEELKFILDQSGFTYEEDEKKNDLWKKVKTFMEE